MSSKMCKSAQFLCTTGGKRQIIPWDRTLGLVNWSVWPSIIGKECTIERTVRDDCINAISGLGGSSCLVSP